MDLLAPESVLAPLKVSSKKQALQALAGVAAGVAGIPEREIFDVLLEREKLGTTGVGQGVAIPHGKHKAVSSVLGFFARLDHPIDFDSVDDRPVDLIFMLLAPVDAGADHLKALARVSRLLRSEDMCDKLRGSDNADAITAVLTESIAHAA